MSWWRRLFGGKEPEMAPAADTADAGLDATDTADTDSRATEREEEGWTSTHEALKDAFSRGEMAALPAEHSIDATDEGGWCLLHFAAALGFTDGVKALLAAGADTEVAEPEADLTPLVLAVAKQRVAAVESLVAGGADANPSGDQGTSLLLMSLSLDPPNERIVRALVTAGADVNYLDSDRRGPLHLAAARGMLEAAREMVERGADTQARDDQGRTPVEVAGAFCSVGKRGQMIRVLLGHAGGDPSTPEEQFRLGLAIVDADLSESERLIKLAASQGHEKAKEVARQLGLVDALGKTLRGGSSDGGSNRSGTGGASMVCSDCGKPDPGGMYQQRADGHRRCQACCRRLGPLVDM